MMVSTRRPARQFRLLQQGIAPRNPGRLAGLGSVAGLRLGRLGYVVQYYRDAPPDAEAIRLIQQAGNTYELIDRPTVELPPPPPNMDDYRAAAFSTYETCSGYDAACNARNVARMTAEQTQFTADRAAWNSNPLVIQYGNVYTDGAGNPVTVPGATTTTPPAATQLPVAVAYRPGTLRFTNESTGNSTRLRVGDKWRVEIAGATPNVQVSVRGGRNGATDQTPMGVTDAAGNFAATGTATADQIGRWSETWYVSSVSPGSFGFDIVAADGTPAGNQPPGGSDTNEPGTTPGNALTRATAWITDNPLMAAGAAIAGGLLLKKAL